MRLLINRNDITMTEALLLASEKREIVAIDIETVDLDNTLPLGIGIAVAPDLSFYFFDIHDELLQNLINQTPTCVFHNVKYDLPILSRYGYTVQNYEDTMILAYSNGLLENKLAELSQSQLHTDCPSVTDQWTVKQKSNIGIDHVVMGEICMIHARNTFNLWQNLPKPDLYYEIDKPVIKLVMEMEEHGIAIDQYRLTQLEQRTVLKARQLEREIKAELGDINLGSNPQVTKALQEKGILGTRKTKAGKDSVSDESLKPLHNPIADKILEYRSEMKTISTYVPAFRNIDNKGRIHTSFGYTDTGRFKSRQPNLQNLTRNDKFEEAE